MSLSLVANFTATENPPSGFVDAGANGIEASGGIGIAENTASIAASAYNTLLTADQEYATDLSFTTFAEARVFAKATSAVSLTADRYFVGVQQTGGNEPDTISIIQRKSTVDTVLITSTLKRGKIASGDQLKIRCYDAGTTTVIQAYYNDIFIMEYKDETNPIQGNGYAGMWLAASSSGMGFDNAYAGNLTVYWVCPSGGASNPTQSGGNDSTGSGTFASPWATIKHGAHKSRLVATGSVLTVRGGDYSARLNDAFSDVLWKAGSDWNNPTTHQAFPGETVRITSTFGGANVNIGSVSNGEFGTNYMQFINIGQNPGGAASSNGFRVSNGNAHIRLINCDLANNDLNGWVTATTTSDLSNHHCMLIGCIIRDNVSSHGVYEKRHGTIFEFCDIRDNGGNGIQIYEQTAGALQLLDNVVRFNQLHGNQRGLVLGMADDTLIYGNLVYRNGSEGGIEMNGFVNPGQFQPRRTLIYNNTIYSNGATTRGGISVVTGAVDTEIKNNILYKNTVKGITDNGTDTVSTNNLNPTTGSETDPLFVSESIGAEDFHLNPASPCRAAGVDLGTPYNLDLDGNVRQSGSPSQWDQGAFQFVQSGDPPIISHSGTYTVVVGSYTAIPATFVDPNSDANMVEVDSAGKASLRVTSIPSGVVVDV